MKKIIIFILCVIFCFSFSSCSKVSISTNDGGTLYFIYGEHNIKTEVSADDLDDIAEIFSNKTLYSDSPSCGFSEKVSLVISKQTFCFANDTCGIVYLAEEDKYFSLSAEENEELKQILYSYGMFFPCI